MPSSYDTATAELAMTLSTLAYVDENRTATQQQMIGEINAALDEAGYPSWRVVWGPALNADRSNLLYAARNSQTGQLAVSIRGSDFSFWLNWIEDLAVLRVVPYNEFVPTVGNTAQIAFGTAVGLRQILRAQDGTESLETFLTAVPEGTPILITGHSLGGCLASVLAPCVADWRGSASSLAVYTIAAPSPGNAEFAVYYNALFTDPSGHSTAFRSFNNLDVVPNAWATLATVMTYYPPMVPSALTHSDGSQSTSRCAILGPWHWGTGAMAQQVCVVLSAAEREQLVAIAADRNRPRKHIERAQIVLTSADRHPVQQVAQIIGVSRSTVWRWQQRFAESGIDGLLRDKTRKPGKAPIAAEIAARVVAMACTEPPHEATHWTGRAMAKAIGILLGSVQRIWQAHKLQPHRLRTFKRSRDPGFADKLTDVVGLYVDPPAHVVVLSIDEKSQIQALDRTQPGLPIKPGRCQTMTHDYKRHGTTTLFAALSVLDGTVIGRCMQRHRHVEFIRFLNTVEREVAVDKSIHVVLDNYATHKHPKVLAWLARHPRWTFHFTPTSASWLNAVENFFSKMTRQRIVAGSSAWLLTCRRRSMLIWPNTMPTPNPSSGLNPPKPFWPNSIATLYHPFESVH